MAWPDEPPVEKLTRRLDTDPEPATDSKEMPVLGPPSNSGTVMNDRQTPSTTSRARHAMSYPMKETLKPAEPGASTVPELDLRDDDRGADAAAAPGDLKPSDMKWTPTVHEAPWEFLTRRQAAERFGLDAAILGRWEKAGKLTPCRKTPRGRVYYAVAELKNAVSEQALEGEGPEPDDERPTVGLVLSPERLWAMVEEAREDALHARMRASAVEGEVRLLREMLHRLLSDPVHASTSLRSGEAAERARRWAGQWEQHERQQQLQQQHELSARGSWWSRGT